MIGPGAVLADLAILLALVAALAGRRMPKMAQPLVATVAFACAWIVAGALDALRAPVWALSLSGAMIVASAVAVSVIVHLSASPGDGTGGGPSPHDDDDGGGRGGPPQYGPQGGGVDSDPSWWPAFEREFGRYVALLERQQREVARPLVPVARCG